MTDVEVSPVTPDRWDDMAELFERPGPRGGTPATAWCFCMWWRERSQDAAVNRPAMQSIVAAGRQPGLLAYVDGRPVGWIAVAPREEYAQFQRSPTLKPADPDAEGVFAVVCFYVHSSHKRQGITRALIAGAIDHARSRGGSVLEAYPSDVLRNTSSTDFMGCTQWFLDAGFEATGTAGAKTVVRYDLT